MKLENVFLPLLLLTAGVGWAHRVAVVSIQPHFDLARQTAGDAAVVTRVLPLGASPHTFDPSPREVARIADADLVVNGGVDEWLLELIAASGAEDEPDDADNHSNVNPHVWLDPLLMAQAVPVLVGALSNADPAHAELYTTKGETLATSLEVLHTEISGMLEPVQDAPFVPFHDAWPYFVRRYGLSQVAVTEPAPGREPSPKYLAEVLGILQEAGATALFTDAQLPARPAEIVAESSGLGPYTLDLEGVTEAAYQNFIRANAATLADALAR